MNYRLCGFSSVEAMVAAMFVNERAHLNAFVEFILSRKLDSMLRAHDWIGFARAYNGPMFHSNQYDYKLKTAYERYSQKKLAKEIAR